MVRTARPAALCAALALALTACGGSEDNSGDGGDLSGTIRIDGSSTVAPLTEAAAELFRAENSGVQITVGTSGTGGGFEKFCAGETDISDASRSIEDDEAASCESKQIEYQELQIANDALTLVVNKENDWATCLTTEQLKTIWDQGSKVDNWNQVDPSFPDESLELFGAGTDSGTFDYFTDAINGEEGRSRTDYNATEDDNVTVTGVAGTKGGLGYFGYSYYEENQDKLTAVEIDSGDGCVAPSVETAQDGTYTPLSRALFIYPSKAALERPEVDAFIAYYLDNAVAIAEQAQFIPLTAEQVDEARRQADKIGP